MAIDEYERAQRFGLKAYKAAVASGRSPYLPVLDEILTHAQIDGEISLGICDIPLNQVVGTCTFGRTTSFASNFMPLLDSGSEFASKWASLYDYQVAEGIRDYIKVYEYMNKYYVLEGNKRVSVLKYLNSPTIQAEVIRKIPRRSDDPENRTYYEYMGFYNLTKIDYLRFSKPGRYAQFLSAVGKDEKTIWTTEEKQDFFTFYFDFQKALKSRGEALPAGVTLADALLFYMTIYPYKGSLDTPFLELKENLGKIWQEILLLGSDDSVELSMDPVREKNTVGAVLNKIMSPRIRKVAFVYDKKPETSDWIYGHELGRLHLQEVFGDSVQTGIYIADPNASGKQSNITGDSTAPGSADVPAANADEVLEQICADGYDIIFAVTPTLIRACLKAAIAHPDVFILNCTLNSSVNTVRTYYTRMYEAKFLTGMIAGSLTANNKVGYVADYPLYGAAASINAFALGAKMVNPNAQVYLAWSTKKDFSVDQYFRENEVFYISDQDMITPQMEIRHFGLYQASDEGKRNLAMSIYNWGAFYEKLIKSIKHGSWWEEADENKAINYWWGLSAGVIDVICSAKLPDGTLKLIELMKQNISSGQFHPFTGPLTQQGGHVHYAANEVMKPEDIMRMDWLADNVIGSIPTIDELREEAQPVVQLRGLYAATIEQGGNLLL